MIDRLHSILYLILKAMEDGDRLQMHYVTQVIVNLQYVASRLIATKKHDLVCFFSCPPQFFESPAATVPYIPDEWV